MKLILLLTILVSHAMAAGVPFKPQTDTFQVGKDTSTDNKQILFNTGDGATNPKLEVNQTSKRFGLNKGLDVTGNATVSGTLGLGTGPNKFDVSGGKLRFSNDGSVYKNLGSGSGGGDSGVNLLENPGFEDGLGGYTNSGGTFTQQTYANGSDGDTKYARFASTGAGQYVDTALVAIPTFGVGACLSKLNYQTVDTSSWKVQVFDSLNNLLGEQNLTAKDWQNGYIPFLCPTVGTLVKSRLISLAAGTINWDKNYFGQENRTYKVKSDISGWIDGGALSITGSVSNPAKGAIAYDRMWYRVVGDSLEVKMNYRHTTVGTIGSGAYLFALPAGYTMNTAKIGAFNVVETALGSFVGRLSDGSFVHQYTGGVYPYSNNKVFVAFQYAQESGASATGAGVVGSNVGSMNYSSVNYSLTFTVPVNEAKSIMDEVINAEAQDWMIDVNIGGASPSLGSVTQPNYVELTNASLDLVINQGSALAKIPCSGTNPATGLTCAAGNESVGVNFTNPQTGFYEACFEFAANKYLPANANIDTTFQVVQTANNSQVITQEGKSRIPSFVISNASGLAASNQPYNLCGTFYFSDVGEKTLRLMYEQVVAGTITTNLVLADRDSSLGQRDIHIRVRPLLSAFNRPYDLDFTNLKNSAVQSSTPNVRIESCQIFNNGTASIDTSSGLCGWVSSVSRTAAGAVNVTPVNGLCSLPPVCNATSSSYGNNVIFRLNGSPVVNAPIQVNSLTGANAATDQAFFITCQCKR